MDDFANRLLAKHEQRQREQQTVVAIESSVTLSPQIQMLDESTLPLEPVEYSPLRELSPQKREIKVDN